MSPRGRMTRHGIALLHCAQLYPRQTPEAGCLQGCVNNQRLVVPSLMLRWRAKWGGSEVLCTGSFNSFTELLPLPYDRETESFQLPLSLLPGHHWYQFLVDGRWVCSPEDLLGPDDHGHVCNHIVVQAPPAFHLFYATGWTEAYLHYREEGGQEFRVLQLHDAPSRDRPSGGRWKSGTIPAWGGSSAQPIEFFLSNHGDSTSARPPEFVAKEDRPKVGARYGGSGSGGTFPLTRFTPLPRHRRTLSPKPRQGASVYRLEGGFGGYKLLQGRVTPFPRSLQPPVLVVSDLDGTMVGDGPEDDAATAAFSRYWEGTAALCGSKLVYNTGRSIGSFLKLFEDKGGRLAMPDVIITAVGTKIFLNDDKDSRRSDQAAFREDERWTSHLDAGWDLGRVRRVGTGVVDSFAASGGVHWLDDGREHRHRIALSVRQDLVDEVKAMVAKGLEDEVRLHGTALQAPLGPTGTQHAHTWSPAGCAGQGDHQRDGWLEVFGCGGLPGGQAAGARVRADPVRGTPGEDRRGGRLVQRHPDARGAASGHRGRQRPARAAGLGRSAAADRPPGAGRQEARRRDPGGPRTPRPLLAAPASVYPFSTHPIPVRCICISAFAAASLPTWPVLMGIAAPHIHMMHDSGAAAPSGAYLYVIAAFI